MSLQPTVFFITGIGTDVGKTLVAQILVRILQADYWKPIQTGLDTDSKKISTYLTDKATLWKEAYHFVAPVSPHLASKNAGMKIELSYVAQIFSDIIRTTTNPYLIIEGAGGVLSPLTETATNIDLMRLCKGKIIIVSRNYLGSLNHSLLTFSELKRNELSLSGWICNGYEGMESTYPTHLVQRTGIPLLFMLPNAMDTDTFINTQRQKIETLFKI